MDVRAKKTRNRLGNFIRRIGQSEPFARNVPLEPASEWARDLVETSQIIPHWVTNQTIESP